MYRCVFFTNDDVTMTSSIQSRDCCFQKWMSRTSVGVPAFSCSDLTADGAAGIGADSGRQELEGGPEALDTLADALLAAVAAATAVALLLIGVAAGDNVRMNSSTCSKHPRRISCRKEMGRIGWNYFDERIGSRLEWIIRIEMYTTSLM